MIAITGCVLALSACSKIPPQAYANHGDPERLLDVSLETINMTLSSEHSLGELAGLIRQDPPTSAELHCAQNDPLCQQARTMFDRRGISSLYTGNPADRGVTLVYQRVVARDCENRYIDNSINPYNLPPPTLGCSITSNTVHMVSDKRQFVNPSLMDFPDSEKSVQNYETYLQPSPAAESQGASTSLIGASSGSGSQ